MEEKRARENVPPVDAKKRSLSSSVPSAATPGRGLSAAAAEQERYENLTEEQKAERLESQKAASAEAAAAIAEASKEEEQKRLELEALEKERLQELEEEAAATAAATLSPGGGSSGSVAEGAFPAGDSGDGNRNNPALEDGESEQDAKLRQVAEALKQVQAEGVVPRKPGGGGGGDMSPAASGAGGGADGIKPQAAASTGGIRRPISRSGSFALDAAAAAAAAVEAVTGVKGFTPDGTMEVVAREAAAAAADGGAATRRAQTVGWGEKSDQSGPGSIKDRLGAFSSGDKKAAVSQGAASAAAAAPGAGGSVAERVTAVEEGFPTEETAAVAAAAAAATAPAVGGGVRGNVHDSVPDIPSVSAGSSASGGGLTGSRSGSAGGVESVAKKGPGSIKDRIEAFSSAGSREGDEGSESGSQSPPPPYRRGGNSVHDSVPDIPSVSERANGGVGGGPTGAVGWGANKDQTGPGSIKDRLGVFGSGDKKAGAGEAGTEAPSSVGESGSEDSNGRGATGLVKDRLDSLNAGRAAAGETSITKAEVVPRRGDVHGAVANDSEAAVAGSEGSIGRVKTLGWGENKDQSAPGSVKDRINSIYGSKAEAGASAGAATAAGEKSDGVPGRRPPPYQSQAARAAANGGLSSTHPSSGSGGSSGSTPSPPKRKSTMTREEAVAALADAEAAAAREEKEWARKVKALEEERRKVREERQRLAVEAAEAAGLPPPAPPVAGSGPRIGGGAANDNDDDETNSVASGSVAGGELPDVKARALRLDEDAKKLAEAKKSEEEKKAVAVEERRRKWAQDSGASVGDSFGREAVPPLGRAGSGGTGAARKPRKRSMKKSGYLTGSFDCLPNDDDGDGMEAKKVGTGGGRVNLM